jgi:CheY-like chemotaxis protein
MTDVQAYRVLVVDDEEKMCAEARRQIAEIDGPVPIEVALAHNPRRAISEVNKSLYDLVLLDLDRQGQLAGVEVYRRLDELGCSVDVLLMSRFSIDDSAKKLLSVEPKPGGPRIVGFFDKTQQEDTNVREEVRKRYEAFLRGKISCRNLELAGQIIDRRRRRYDRPGIFPLRPGVEELTVEVERLLRSLYVEIPPSGERSVDVTVALSPVERRGLSAAVVVNATVGFALKDRMTVDGHKTVLKIGPKRDILEEASRYREFVRYGIELDERVELLAVSARDSLGALVYSFAGGVHHNDLLSLDDLLTADLEHGDVSLSRSVLATLFKTKNWYSVESGDTPVGRYFSSNYRTTLSLSVTAMETSLRELPQVVGGAVGVQFVSRQGRDDSFYRITVADGGQFVVPDRTFLGSGALMVSVPGCLVHGDMHAGNIMLEMLDSDRRTAESGRSSIQRVCLIDFRNAGPGPRCVDAVALESSIRLADGEAVSRGIGGVGESQLGEDELKVALMQVSERVSAERALYRAVFLGEGAIPEVPWCQAAAEVLVGLRNCFPVSLDEYLSTSIRYTLRQLGFDMLPIARVRVLAWLGAQYELLREL